MRDMLTTIYVALTRRPESVCHDPEGTCPFCDGAGWLKYFDADTGWHHNPCLICDGVTSTGVYVTRGVLHVAGREVHHEFSWHGCNLAAALRQADRIARRIASSSLGFRAVRVVWLGPGADQHGECVHEIEVRREALPLTAA